MNGFQIRCRQQNRKPIQKQKQKMKISVIIPAFNEAAAIAKVIADIPKGFVDEIIVVDNGSTDNTARVAIESGARVVNEPRRGYGAACLAGMAALTQPDIVVFMDADYSDDATEIPCLVQPILEDDMELVIGARVPCEKGALLPQARFGNRMATLLIRWLFGIQYTDLGPFRAIRYSELMAMRMRDKNFGWTVEMQLKAAKMELPVCEVPVRYRKRIGVSKISGTFLGTVKAGYKILTTVFYYRFFQN